MGKARSCPKVTTSSPFLAGEEEKHARYFRKILEERYPGEDITPPEKTPVPLPELKLGDESIP